MNNPLPSHTIQPVPEHWLDDEEFADWPWHKIAPLSPFVLADGSAPAQQQTTVRLAASDEALYIRFECEDRDIWWNYEEHNDPIYDEEVVEVFIADGSETPKIYYELEVSPGGIVFFAQVNNPQGDRTGMKLNLIDIEDSSLNWIVDRYEDERRWLATIELLWEDLNDDGKPSEELRANFYRIERPRDPETQEQTPEFSCWSPTLTDPADFHRPARFGRLTLE